MVGVFQFPAAVLNTATGYFSQSKHIHWLISVLAGIVMCKIVYEITGLVSLIFFKAYSKLNKAQKIEWSNRVLRQNVWCAAIAAPYLISIGYFLLDLGMILWYFPALGGLEYVLHHGLSLFPIFLSLVSGQGQIYILMVLFSESTTPFVNLRWYLDISGQKSSKFYFCNGTVLFLGWLVARILLFIFLFTHMYLRFGQVKKIFPLGFYTLLLVSPMLAMMNVYWFWKIAKGLMKTVYKARHSH